MILRNAIDLTLVAVTHLLLFMLVPFWVRGFRLSQEDAAERLVTSYILGNVVVINCVYLLSLIGIYNRVTMISLLLLIAAAVPLIRTKQTPLAAFRRAEAFYLRLADGSYHKRLIGKAFAAKTKFFFSGLVRRMGNPINLAVTAAILGVAAYMRGFHSVNNMFLGTSDMYLHVEWIKLMDANNPFAGGVYPFGYHCAISAMGQVFGFDVITVMRMLGPISGMMIVLSLYFVLKKTFRSNLAVHIGMTFYCVLNVFQSLAVNRQLLALPQEYGMMFLLFGGYFLQKYMRRRELTSLVAFAGAVALTFMAHFFITIYAVALCVAVFLAHLAFLNRRVFVRLVIGTVCSVVVMTAPMGAALLMGKPLQDSIYWALGMLDWQQVEEPEVEPEPEISALEKLRHPVRTLTVEKPLDEKLVELSGMQYEWFLIFVASMGVGLIFPIFKFKGRERQWDVMGYSLYALLVLVMIFMPEFGLPALMGSGSDRMLIFLIFSVPPALGAPLELLYNLFHRFGKFAVAVHALIALAIGGGMLYYVIEGGHRGQTCTVVQMQYNGAVMAYYAIAETYPDGSWTILSKNDEYSLCLHKGYHAQLTQFIFSLNNFHPAREVIIPTEHLFIYIDKRPREYSRAIDLYKGGDPMPPIDPADVYAPLDELIEMSRGEALYVYKNLPANRILQAKALAWAQEYSKYFPNEMKIYYEDDEIVIYQLEQDPYAPNNLAIPYAGNHWGTSEDLAGDDQT